MTKSDGSHRVLHQPGLVSCLRQKEMDGPKYDDPLRLRDVGAIMSGAHEGVETRKGLAARDHVDDADSDLHNELLRDEDP